MTRLGAMLPGEGAALEIFDWLVRESLYAGVVFAVVWVCSRLLQRRGPDLHHALWWLVLLRLVLPVDLSHPLAVGRLLNLGQAGVPVATSAMSAGPEVHLAGVVGTLADGSSAAPGPVPWTAMAVGAWAVCVLVIALSHGGRRRKVRHIVAGAREVESGDLLAHVERWRQRFAIRRVVRLVVTAERCSPFTVGLWRPTIVIPDRLLRIGSACEAAVAHEMAHVKRVHVAWLEAQRWLHCVYFFHPLVWFAGSRIAYERERQCDAMVLDGGGFSARRYAKALVDVAELGAEPGPVLSFTTPMRRVKMRVQNILGYHASTATSRVFSMIFVLILGAVFLPLAGSASLSGAPEAPMAPPSPPAVAVPVSAVPAAVAPPAPPVAPAAAAIQPEAPRPVSSAPAAPAKPIELVEPVPGARLTLGWGRARHPFKGGEFFHQGADLAAPDGTAVLAAADGVVQSVLVDFDGKDTGRYVVIGHDHGYSTYYGHLGEVMVDAGRHVVAGETIATVGMTGLTTGPHVHFELRQGEDRLDPMASVSHSQ